MPDVNDVNNEEQDGAPIEDTQAPSNAAPAKEPKTVSITDVELDQLKSEANDYKDKYIRLLAESENARKRMQKERQEMVQYALQNTIVDFLIPIDHMENALKHAKNMSEEVKHWAIGFDMILGQFKDVLSNNGVAPFESKGRPFDPHRHEAVEMIETDEAAPGTIVDETIRGYEMGGRTIRPARVTVAKAPKAQDTDIPQSAENTNAESQ